MTKWMPLNEGPVDRVLRTGLGLGMLALLAVGPVPGWGLIGLVGLVPLVTGVVGFCPIYAMFGLNTCPVDHTA